MAVYHTIRASCTCGKSFETQVARSLNAARTPSIREKILRGDLHQAMCPDCGNRWTVESPFYYADALRNCVFHVRPREERFKYRAHSDNLDKAVSDLPHEMFPPAHTQLRVVYGLDELREKIVAQDAGLGDRNVELLKVLVLRDHPFLLRQPRLALHLSSATSHSLKFVAYHRHGGSAFEAEVPRALADDLLSDTKGIEQWTSRGKKENSIVKSIDHWVSIKRLSPKYDALERLRFYANEVLAGRRINLSSKDFTKMLKLLPRGPQLTVASKKDLQTLFNYARSLGNGKAEDLIFEVRFGIELADDWAHNSDPNDIDTIWKLLRDVPVSNIEGNINLLKIELTKGEGGGVYGDNVISIGETELGNRERFEDVLRHEVGHAVHENRDAIVSPWLTSRFGWRQFDASTAGIDGWVTLMGGWGGLTATQRAEVAHYLRQALGGGSSWNPGPAPKPPASHPWWKQDFGPRLAYEKTGPNWFENYQTWHRSGGRAFFLNYWYGSLMVVDEVTLNLVASMPDSYAAMSHFEFFAELYSLYYDYDDPKRSVVPLDVAAWLDSNIGKRDPKNPRRPKARPRP